MSAPDSQPSVLAVILNAYISRLSTKSIELIVEARKEVDQMALNGGMRGQMEAQDNLTKAVALAVDDLISHDKDLIAQAVVGYSDCVGTEGQDYLSVVFETYCTSMVGGRIQYGYTFKHSVEDDDTIADLVLGETDDPIGFDIEAALTAGLNKARQFAQDLSRKLNPAVKGN